MPELWWLVLLKGLSAIILGVLLLAAPAATTMVIVQFLGIYWFVSGVLGIVHIFVDSRLWGWKLLSGVLGIIAGIIVIQNPIWSSILVPATLVVLLGVQGLMVGVIYIIRAFSGAGLGAGLLGVIDVIFGIILLGSPIMAAATLPFVFGGFLVVGGLIAAIMSFSLRGGMQRAATMMGSPQLQGLPSTGKKEE
jgi:uncharacterized membrane protein HdeD (DUF308 family)